MAPIAEYFLLRDALALSQKISEPSRKKIADALALGRQKADAAEALWSNGHAAEGLRLAVEALFATESAADAFAQAVPAGRVASKPAEPKPSADAEARDAKRETADAESDDAKRETADAEGGDDAKSDTADAKSEAADAKSEAGDAKSDDAKADTKSDDAKHDVAQSEASAAPTADATDAASWRATLARRGVPEARVRALGETDAKARALVLPRLDADVSPGNAELFLELTRARREMHAALHFTALTGRELAWTRATRIASVSVLGAVVLAVLVSALRPVSGVTAHASATWQNAANFLPENVLDGNEATEWLLPDGATGWVEARIAPATHVSSVTITNADNPSWYDRATRAYRVELYSGTELVASEEGEFETLEHGPAPRVIAISGDDIDRIRFVARSHHGASAGLADLAWAP